MTRSSILVTGATGTLGSALLADLASQQAQVRAAVRDPGRITLPPGVEPVHFDFLDPSTFKSALTGISRLFLMLPPGVAGQALRGIIRRASQSSVRQVVFLSIFGADKLGVVPHRGVERLLERSGLDWVFLRANYFMQNLSGIHADELRHRGEVFVPAGEGRLGLVDARDVAAVGAKALMEGHRRIAYDLTGGESLTFGDVARIFREVLGRPVEYRNPSIPHFYRQMRRRGISVGLTAFMIIEYSVTRLKLTGNLTSTVQEVLGRAPIPLRTFVEDYRRVWLE